MKVGINAPKTPITVGSGGVAAATVPNVCKMPGPPAPFVPTPLPNIGKSSMSPKDYSKTVLIEGKYVAIKGATFGSVGDIASKATGGGIISANTHGPTSFVAPGSLDVMIEGKNVHLLGDATTNNNGSPSNAATVAAMNPNFPNPNDPSSCGPKPFPSQIDCEKNKKEKDWDDCDVAQLCVKVAMINEMHKTPGTLTTQPAGRNKLPEYREGKGEYLAIFATAVANGDKAFTDKAFYHPCAEKRWHKNGAPAVPNKKAFKRAAFEPDHIHDCQLGCDLLDTGNFLMLSQSVNGSIGAGLAGFVPEEHSGVKLENCDCEAAYKAVA